MANLKTQVGCGCCLQISGRASQGRRHQQVLYGLGPNHRKGWDFLAIGAAQDGQSCVGKLMSSPSQEVCKLRLEAGAKETFQVP